MPRSILITGGAGYIGTHILTLLKDPQDTIVVVDNLANGRRTSLNTAQDLANRPLTHFCQGDLSTPDALHLLTMLFQKFQFSIVIHLAAYKSIKGSQKDPISYYHNNVVSTLNLVRAMAENNCKTLIFSSSATVYAPQTDNAPCYEHSSLRASNCYGRTKIICEEILRDLCTADPEWTVISLRYFNPIGAHPSGKLGETISGDSTDGLIPALCAVAAGHAPHITIFGNNYSSHDGSPIRDFVHIMDLAAGHIAALESINNASKGFDVYNLGTGHGSSVKDMIDCMRSVTKKTISLQVGPRRSGDVGVVYANVEKAAVKLRWRAVYDITRMCSDAWASFSVQSTLS